MHRQKNVAYTREKIIKINNPEIAKISGFIYEDFKTG